MRSERGITGLETALILIAFIVVASVFAYTVLTAGIFSSQKSNEAVNAAIDEVRSSVTPAGSTIAYKGAVDIDRNTATSENTDAVVRVAMTVAVALRGVPVDVTPSFQLNSTNASLEESSTTNTLVVNYLDQAKQIENAAWTVKFSGANDGDNSLELSPIQGAPLMIERVVPQSLQNVMNLR
jgi:flagellin FlaB